MLRQALLRRVPAPARHCLQRRRSLSSSGSSSGAAVQFGRLAAALPGYIEEYGHGWVPRSYVRPADGYTMGIDAAKARTLWRRGALRDVDVQALIDAGLVEQASEYRWDRVVTCSTEQCFVRTHARARVRACARTHEALKPVVQNGGRGFKASVRTQSTILVPRYQYGTSIVQCRRTVPYWY